jgi:hypothetical protein
MLLAKKNSDEINLRKNRNQKTNLQPGNIGHVIYFCIDDISIRHQTSFAIINSISSRNRRGAKGIFFE